MLGISRCLLVTLLLLQNFLVMDSEAQVVESGAVIIGGAELSVCMIGGLLAVITIMQRQGMTSAGDLNLEQARHDLEVARGQIKTAQKNAFATFIKIKKQIELYQYENVSKYTNGQCHDVPPAIPLQTWSSLGSSGQGPYASYAAATPSEIGAYLKDPKRVNTGQLGGVMGPAGPSEYENQRQKRWAKIYNKAQDRYNFKGLTCDEFKQLLKDEGFGPDDSGRRGATSHKVWSNPKTKKSVTFTCTKKEVPEYQVKNFLKALGLI